MIGFIDPTAILKLEYPDVEVEVEEAFMEQVSNIVDGEKSSDHFKRLQSLFESQGSFSEFNTWLKKEGCDHLVVEKSKRFPDVDDDIGRDTVIQFAKWLLVSKKVDVTKRLT